MWISHTYMPHNKYCSCCKRDSPYNKRWDYCPYCGNYNGENKMISIELPDYKDRLCNVCNQKNDVKMIVLRYDGTSSGTQVALCRECREVLLEELKNS